jgi:hypothetical protein
MTIIKFEALRFEDIMFSGSAAFKGKRIFWNQGGRDPLNKAQNQTLAKYVTYGSGQCAS